MTNRASLLFLCCVLAVTPLRAQSRQFVPTDDWTYALFDYWLTNDSLRLDHILNQPYPVEEVQSRMTATSGWTTLVQKHFQHHFGNPGEGRLVFYGREQLSLVSDTNMPVRKAFESPLTDDIRLFDNRSKNHYYISAQARAVFPHLTLVNRTTVNSEYLDDPLYAGDTSEKIYGRVQDAYAEVAVGGFDLFAGRMARNWGAVQQYGLILSDNAYTFDHIQLAYTTKKVKFSFLISRLEDLEARYDEFPDSLFNARKFLTAQRLDFSFSRRFQAAFTQMVVYGGPERDFELAFLNPANVFYLSQRNDGLQMNGLWSLDFFYKPHRLWNLTAQLLIDDFVVNNDPGQDDRARYPDRLGLSLSLANADVLLPGLQTKLLYSRLGNRTYQSRRTWENFHYRGKSLGFPSSSTEKVSLQMNYFHLFPVLVQFEGFYQRRGNVRLTDLFPLRKEKFPVGTVEKHVQTRLRLRYFMRHNVRFSLAFGFETFTNFNNVLHDDRNNFFFTLGMEIRHALPVRLN